VNFKWILFVASRYIFRKQKKSPSAGLSIAGIAVGVFALIVIIAVMNGFQLGFIESILEVSSYHIRITGVPAEKNAEAAEALLTVPGITAAVPFHEFQGLIRGRRRVGQQAVVVRGLPENTLALDQGMAAQIEFERGGFYFDNGNSILLGAELARHLGVGIGDEITLFSIDSLFFGGDIDDSDEGAASRVFSVGGLFRTGFFEYDRGWAIMDIAAAASFSDSYPVIGVKIANRFHDQRILNVARGNLAGTSGFENANFSSWREYNRSFFGALRTEKLFMFILVGLIFIVVGLNIYQAQRRSVLEHREDVGLLRAVGADKRAVRLVFVFDGAIIGFAGAVTGLIPALIITSNISAFFTVIENIANFFIDIANSIAGLFGAAAAGSFAIFSPAVFYLREIPSRVIPGEVVLIFLFGFLSALAAAWFASRKVSQIQPAEVLRYE